MTINYKADSLVKVLTFIEIPRTQQAAQHDLELVDAGSPANRGPADQQRHSADTDSNRQSTGSRSRQDQGSANAYGRAGNRLILESDKVLVLASIRLQQIKLVLVNR